MSNIITGDGMMTIGGAERPYYIGTLQTAIFCELADEPLDLQDYNRLFTEIGLNQHYIKEAREKKESFTPIGRKALTPNENARFIYSALAAGVRRLKQAVAFTVEDVMQWIDDAEQADDSYSLEELAKPLSAHYQLLTQKINRQAQRAGNGQAPTTQAASRGETAMA